MSGLSCEAGGGEARTAREVTRNPEALSSSTLSQPMGTGPVTYQEVKVLPATA